MCKDLVDASEILQREIEKLNRSKQVTLSMRKNLSTPNEHNCKQHILNKTYAKTNVMETNTEKTVIVLEDKDLKKIIQNESVTPVEAMMGGYGSPPITRKHSLIEEIYKQESRNIAIIDSNDKYENEGVDGVIDDQESAPIYFSNSKGEFLQEDSPYQNKAKLEAICDPESEDEFISEMENQCHKEFLNKQSLSEKQKVSKVQSNNFGSTLKRGKSKSENFKRITPKVAAEMRMEIQSESQRMIREKNVILPYHKPKLYNIKEFLSCRRKFAMAVPVRITAPPSLAMKMTTEQLAVMSKKLKEREEELKDFYKSDCDSDDNGSNEDYLPPITDICVENDHAEKLREQSVNVFLDSEPKISKPSSKEITPNEQEDILLENRDKNGEAKETDAYIQFNILLDHHKSSKHRQEGTSSLNPNEDIANYGSKNESNDCDPHFLAYDFNLDGLEGHTESVPTFHNLSDNISNNLEKRTTDKFVYTNPDKEIQYCGKEQEKSNKLCHIVQQPKLELVKEKVGYIMPKLSGGPDQLIDLDSNLNKPSEVVQLMQRFAKHATSKKENHKHKVHLSIVTVECGGDIHKETVAINVDDEDSPEIQAKPGAKLKRLRQELQIQMAQRKSQIWQQKSSKNFSSANIQDKKEGYEDDLVFDDEVSITESEEDIEDVRIEDKPIKNSVFLDEEAEENQVEEENNQALDHEKHKATDGLVSGNCDVINEDHAPFATRSTNDKTGNERKKYLKRIIKTCEDSDEDTNSVDNISNTDAVGVDDVITPHQPQPHTTPVRQPLSEQKSAFDFLTPISFLTGLQSLNSASKLPKHSPILISPFRINQDSPTKGYTFSASQKKLFLEEDTANSQITHVTQIESHVNGANEVQTQDLLNICSGQFTGVTQLELSAEIHTDDIELNRYKEIKILGEDQDFLISQLLDEKEIENFKNKFESPTEKRSHLYKTSYENTQDDAKETVGGGVIDSDHDNDSEIEVKVKRNKRQILYSDDENSDENHKQDEKIELADEDEIDDIALNNINYDSEENEIHLSQQHKKNVITDFLEAEAELSESEWGSEDEDEKDLDILDFEEGDMEKFDEDKVREDLEKIHMRRLLDDDMRQVKILQELLLEDGELNGTGRQRQFRWKNVNDANDGEENKVDDVTFMDEEDSEEQWRKKRHEREMFLKEQKEKSLESTILKADLIGNSQLLKIGHKVLQKSQIQSNSLNSTLIEKSDENTDSSVLKQFNLLHKRGSFLSRSDQVLQKAADYSKVSAVFGVGASKTTRNFIFQQMSATEQKKRKAPDGTPNMIKKLRLSNLSPALKNRSNKVKTLFNDM